MRKFSVVVPAFNEQLLLPACLESLLAQEYEGEIEILVVDNASTDETASVARRYGARVVEEPQRGYCNALMRGFGAARGDVIACTDADSVVPPDWIARIAGEYDRSPDIVAVGGDIEFQCPNWKSRVLTHFLIPWINRIDRGNPAGPHLWGANLSVRRDAFLAVGGWNPKFSLQADSELSERLRKAGRVVVIESLRVRTSSRRWNRSLLFNIFLFASNWVWFHVFSRPLYREFPAIRNGEKKRDPVAVPRFGGRVAWMCALILFLGAAAGWGAFQPRSSLFGQTYWTGRTQDKVVALTFDDGPNEPYTGRVLDILRREHVTATFFLIGSNVRRSPESVERTVREGHVVGNHSDSHPLRFALQSTPEIEKEIDAAEQTIHAAGGRYPALFRPPQGLRSPWLLSVVGSDSLVAVNWDDAPEDWDPWPAAVLVKRTIEQAHPGAIILLHDGMNLTHFADQGETVKALPAIIDSLRARGYRFVTVPELLGVRASLARWPQPGPLHANSGAKGKRAS